MYQAMAQLRDKVSKGERGFTLVELLIVVAIIGILAAIAIPQFAAYRLRSYNASGLSDMRNSKTSEEALFADWQVYGVTNAAALAAPGGLNGGVGIVVVGPGNPATPNIITTTDVNGTDRGLQIATGNRISLVAHTDAAGASFTVASKHNLGDSVWAGDSDSTATYSAPEGVLIGVGFDVTAAEALPPVALSDEYALAGLPWVTR